MKASLIDSLGRVKQIPTGWWSMEVLAPGKAWRRKGGPESLRARPICSGLKNGPSIDRPTQNLHMWPYLEKVFADVRISRRDHSAIIPLGPKSNGKCPYEREDTDRAEKQKRPCEDRGSDWIMGQPQAKECLDLPEAEGSQEEFSPTTFRGSMALLPPWFWPFGLQSRERINVCCQPPSLR